MTTGKTIALTRWNFVGKVMSLLFNMLSRLVIAFLPMSRHLLISWLQSPSAVILESTPLKELHSSEGDRYILKEKICVSEEYQRKKKIKEGGKFGHFG